MAEKIEQPDNITFNETQARKLAWVQCLEAEAVARGVVAPEDLKTCTAQALRELDGQANEKSLLLARADCAVELLRRKEPDLVSKQPAGIPFVAIGMLFCLLAFGLGVLTDQLSSSGNRINLLAPPLLALFFWNLAVYLWLTLLWILKKLGLKGLGLGPFRGWLATLLEKAQTFGAARKPVLANFYQRWLPREMPLMAKGVKIIFHAAAMTFGLGLIFSIFMRGWSTAYTAGWESTWLADQPALVLTFLKAFYGLIPIPDGLFTHLTAETVAQMRFDVTPAGYPASPWILRLIAAAVLVIVLPRLLLTLAGLVGFRRYRDNFPVNLQSNYFLNILRQWHGKTMSVYVAAFALHLSGAAHQSLESLADAMSPAANHVYFSEANYDSPAVPAFDDDKGNECWIVFSMTATPETEVHGAYLDEVRKACTDKSALCRVIVDTAAFTQRFASLPQRIAQRKRAWSEFLANYNVSYAFSDLNDIDTNAAMKALEG